MVFLLWPIWGHTQSLNLTAPNGGEVWLGGTTHTISWTYTNVDNIKIEYSLNNGLNWTLIIASYPTSALSYTWTVPCIGSNQVKVRITNTLQFTQDESNGVFTIPEPTVDITYPAGGEEFQTGTGQYLTWQTTGVVTLALQYSANGGATWTSIGNVPASNGYANWIAPSSATANLRVRAYNIESFANRDSTLAPLAIVTSPPINNAKYFGGLYDGYDMSSSLPDSIRVVAPNGGEVYNPTSTTQIQWNFCDVNRVKIEYSIDNGAAWTLIATDVPADQLNYTWTIPNSPSNQCLVKVTGIDRNVFDVSNAVFTINNAFVQLVYPNGGESFGNSTGQYIEWDYNSVSTVKLEYSTDNGSSWTSIGTAPAANRYANWIAPASASNQCLIRISDNTVPALSDQSESSFAIVQVPVLNNAKYFGGPYDGYSMNSSVTDSIKVTSPNGGEIWTSASTRTITWTYKDVDNVIIEYSLDDGQNWIQLAQNIPASQLSYNWTIPTTPSYTCRVRVRDMIRDISDMSDQVFIIPNAYVEVTYPNGGENYNTGSGQYIEWNYADLATIKLEYSTDNGNTWLVIGTAPAANKYANWVAPSSASTQMLIRATDNSNPIYSDVSNAVFTTNTSPTLNNAKYFGGQFDGYSMYAFKDVYVKVIKPNGGEIWGNGTTQQIRWATLNSTENLKVEYSIDNEQNWTTLLNDVPNSPVTFDWEIASPPSTICKVRATTMSGEVVDKSDDFFTIANPSGILTNPISGNQFCSGESTVVTYSSGLTFNSGNRFIVQLSDSVGTFSGSLINIGEVTSTVPVPITVTFPARYYTSSLYRLRVIATNTPTLGTNNGTNFTINPLPLVNLGPDRSICAGSSSVLNALNGNSTYVWSTGATTSSISASTAGTYSVQVTNSCGTSRDTIQIGVINNPTVYLGPDTLICLNSVLQLRADSADVSYLWSTGSTSQSINVVVPGTYSVTVSNTCGIASDLITIGNLAPIQVNLGPDRGICSGESVILNAGSSNASYSWSTGATAPSITVSNPGTYSVNVNNGCGIVSDQITLFNGAFQVNTGIDRTICSGESVQLTATGANGYSWNTGQTTSSITVSPTTTTTYTVSATNIYNCTSTDAVVVNVNALPAATAILSGPSTYCANQLSVLQANSGAGLSYQWQQNGSNVTSATSASFSPAASGNYTVRVTNAQNCSATSTVQAITVLTVPSADITPSGNVNLCSGSSVTLQANVGDGLSYAWNQNGSALSNANASSLLATQSGSYTVQVTAANGCSATSQATQIIVNETPTISIAADGPVSFCAGGSVQLTATASAGTTLQWEKDGVDISGSNGTTLLVNAAGIYSARATSASNCSSSSGAIVVTVTQNESVSQNETSCGAFTWAINGNTYSTSGQYTATIGCAIYTLNLTITGGSTCDDNDPCTINDVIVADCSCAGTFADVDNDGTCDANDNCAGPEAGSACDDSDPCTVGDLILSDCSCSGTFADADNDGTCDANDLCEGAELFSLASSSSTYADGSYHASFTISGPASVSVNYQLNGVLQNTALNTDGLATINITSVADSSETYILNLLSFETSAAPPCIGELALSDTLTKCRSVMPTLAYKYTNISDCPEVSPANPQYFLGYDEAQPLGSTLFFSTSHPVDLGQWSEYITGYYGTNFTSTRPDEFYYGLNIFSSSNDSFFDGISEGSSFIVTLDSMEYEGCVSRFANLADTTRMPPAMLFMTDDYFSPYITEDGVQRVGCLYDQYSSDGVIKLQDYDLYINSSPPVGYIDMVYQQEIFADYDFEFEINGDTVHFNNFSNVLNSYYGLISIAVVDNVSYMLDLDGNELGLPGGPSLSIVYAGLADLANDTIRVKPLAFTGPGGCRVEGFYYGGYNYEPSYERTYVVYPTEILPEESVVLNCGTSGIDLVANQLPVSDYGAPDYYWINEPFPNYDLHSYLLEAGYDYYSDTLLVNQPGTYSFISRDNQTCQYYQKQFTVTTLADAHCDDSNPCTINDLYDENCTCAGTFADADNDGACDANDLCWGPEPGTACDDNDPCTVNDLIQSDCTCAGTFADADFDGTCDANDLCAGPEAGAACDDNDACTINDVIQSDCTCAGTFADGDGDGTCDANDLCSGPEAGTACDDADACTINDVIQSDCTCAGIFADGDNDGTCDANDLCWGPEPGAACDDNNPCTVNDLIQSDCTCAGVFADSDQDGTCDANDLCWGPEPGTACDDNDPCTVNDLIQSDCTCTGTFADADFDGTCDANDLCGGGPEPGSECNDRDDCTVDDMIQADCSCAGVYLDSDADGTCDAFDLCADSPEPGMACNDGNPCTINDTVNASCECVGTPVETPVSLTTIQTCEPYTWNGQTYAVSGNYEFATQTTLGCDSLARLALTVGTPTFSSQTITNCGSYTWNGTSYSLSGTYTYVTTNSTGCPKTETLNLTVNTLSTAASSVAASANNVNAGTSVTLTVQGGSLGTGASWKWYRSACGGTLIGIGTSITITANATDTYYVRAEGTCNTTTCSTITVNVLSAQCGPEVVSASSTRICSGSSTTLSVLGTLYPGAIWRWRRTSCSGTIVGTGANLVVAPTATTTYYVRAEGGTCGITLCMEITIIVDKMPSTPSVISGPTTGLCNAQNVTYSVTPVSTVQQYNWTVPPGITIVSGQGTASVTVNVSNFINTNPTNGNPAICVTAQNSCGISPIRCLSLTTYPATPASISGPTAPCINSVNTYSCPVVFGATSYTWQVPTGWVIQSGQGTASITVLCNGTSGNVRVRSVNACGNSTNRSLACAPAVCSTTAMPMQLELWPNPTSERVFFAYDEEQPELFEIYDMMGRTIYSGSWIPEFDVTGLAGGIYFVRATSGGESVVKRMEVIR